MSYIQTINLKCYSTVLIFVRWKQSAHYIENDLRTEATHVKSGEKIITDAPIDNHGKGEAFSPTDLLVSIPGKLYDDIDGNSW